MKIDTDAFVDSLPIMGNGLLGIFIVTVVIIISIYILKALTSGKTKVKNVQGAAAPISDPAEAASDAAAMTGPAAAASPMKKESAMDLMKEREKKDFLESDDTFTISNDL
ncbi:MAG: hypothetical protein K5897_08295 [Eubacterium sp.]|nr:hypothetical protein [Eubacterium sp.]